MKNVIPIRKEYGVYVKEDDIAVAELDKTSQKDWKKFVKKHDKKYKKKKLKK